MAPEQAGRAGGVGPAADVYALGAILYEMLTGRPPFRATSVLETAQQVLTQEPVPPTHLQPKIPRDLETICLACLRKDPAARYASAEALGEDLRRFLDHEPILAHRTPLPDRIVKWARRRPTLALTLSAAILLGTVLVNAWGDLTYALRSERDQARADQAQTAAHLQNALATIDQISDGRLALLRAAAFYEALAQESRDQRGQRPVAAHAYQRLGDLRRQLGEPVAAERAYREAIALFMQLSNEFPERDDLALRLSECRQQRARLEAAVP
jgi:hypothetical protein